MIREVADNCSDGCHVFTRQWADHVPRCRCGKVMDDYLCPVCGKPWRGLAMTCDDCRTLYPKETDEGGP